MKKLLLIAAVCVLTSCAGTRQRDRGRHDPANDRYQMNSQTDEDNRLAAINNDYNNRIDEVRHESSGRARDRRRRIKELEKERQSALDASRNTYATPQSSRQNGDHRDNDRH